MPVSAVVTGAGALLLLLPKHANKALLFSNSGPHRYTDSTGRAAADLMMHH